MVSSCVFCMTVPQQHFVHVLHVVHVRLSLCKCMFPISPVSDVNQRMGTSSQSSQTVFVSCQIQNDVVSTRMFLADLDASVHCAMLFCDTLPKQSCLLCRIQCFFNIVLPALCVLDQRAHAAHLGDSHRLPVLPRPSHQLLLEDLHRHAPWRHDPRLWLG